MPITEEELEGEIINKRIHFWNRIFRITLVLLMLAAIGIQLKANDRAAKATLEARKANISRQHELQDYIKCLSILKFDSSADLTTREGVIKALDGCASKN